VRRTPSLSLVEVVSITEQNNSAPGGRKIGAAKPQRIDAIQNAAPSLDHPAKILDADVAP